MKRLFWLSTCCYVVTLFFVSAHGESNVSQTSSVVDATLVSAENKQKLDVEEFCNGVAKQYAKYRWGDSPCTKIPWRFDTKSENGVPLVYAVFENVNPDKPYRPDDTTLFFGGVHGDEPSGVFVLFRFAQQIADNPSMIDNHRVVIAPLVNPDGFFAGTRANKNSVDLNRNFPTKDWKKNAHALWKKRRWGNPQHFPGKEAGSEKGTVFQMELLEQFSPDKLFSLHSPLDFVDYDGPGASKRVKALTSAEKKAHELAYIFAKKTRNTRVINYQFYPGSLGNFAGNERNIPTITLEFSTSNYKAAEKHWADVMEALKVGVKFTFQKLTLATSEPGGLKK